MGSRGTLVVVVLALVAAWFVSKALDARAPTWDAPFDEPEPTATPIDLDKGPPTDPGALYVTVEYDRIEMPFPGATVTVDDGNGRRLRQTVDAAGWAVFAEVRSPEPTIAVEAGGWELVADPRLERLADGSRLARLRMAWGRPLVGRVVDADTGEPIEGAHVRAVGIDHGDNGEPLEGPVSCTVNSDATGRFRIPAFEHVLGGYRLVHLDAVERRHAAVRARVDASVALATSNGLTVRMPKGRSLVGTVRLGDGRPAQGAKIRPTAPWQDEWPRGSTLADEGGRWQIDGLPIDVPTWITAESREAPIPATSEVRAAVDDTTPARLELAFSAVARLEVDIRDSDGAGVAGFEIVLSTPRSKTSGFDQQTLRSNDEGVVSFDVAAAGEIVGYVDTNQLVRPDSVGPDGLRADLGSRFGVRLAPNEHTRLTLWTPRGRSGAAALERHVPRRLWGRVVDERGRPLGRAVLRFDSYGQPLRIVCDGAGAFDVLADTSSDLSLDAEAPGWREAGIRANAAAPVRVVMTRRDVARFVVEPPGGVPTWSRLDAPYGADVLVAPPHLSPSGRWEFLASVADLDETGCIRMEADNGVGAVVGSVRRDGARASGTTLVRPELGASVSGRVVDDVGNPVAGTLVVADEWGVASWHESRFPDWLRNREAVTGPDGRFLLTGFGDRGSIHLVVARGEAFEVRTSIQSEFGRRARRCPDAIEIRLPRHGTILVTTRDAIGHRRRRVALKLRETVASGATDRRVPGYLLTDDAGEYEARLLPGTYEVLEFDVSNRRTETFAATHPVVVRPGETTRLELVVGPATIYR